MKIAVLFPGIGYHCDKPLLYYAAKLARECGYERIVKVGYGGFETGIKGDVEKMKRAAQHAYAEAVSILSDREKIVWEEYEEILFLSKSVGTYVAAAYSAAHDLKARQVFYTPLAETLSAAGDEAIAFSGTGDPWVDPEQIKDLCAQKKILLYRYEGVNHSLESGDPLRDLEVLKDVMIKTRERILS